MEYYSSGNSYYQAGDISSALQQYSLGLQHHTRKDELHAKLLLNRAQCYLRNEQYTEASKDCSLLISISSYQSVDTSLQQLILKAHLRRAQAHEYLGNYSKALADVEHVLNLDPPISLRKTAVATRSKLKQFVDVDHKVSLSEGRPKMMVTDQQALRLAFIEQPPETFVLGESYLIRLCIMNELGLWDRDFIRRSFAVDHTNRAASIADMQCSLSEFDLTEGAAELAQNSQEGSEGRVDCSRSIEMEMQTCHSTANSSPLSIGEDGKIDLFITLRPATSTTSSTSAGVDFSNLAVMLRFSLDRPLPSSGEVLPVLSLPARVQSRAGTGAVGPGAMSGSVRASVDIKSRSTAYERVLELCRDVHATCVRQIPLAHTRSTAVSDTRNTPTSTTHTASNTSTLTRRTADPAFSAYALESPGYLGIAGKVWDSMYVLLQYLAQHEAQYVHNKRIVELGCGTGLAGISLCPMCPLQVTLTDMPEVVPLIRANILLNSVVLGDAACMDVLSERYCARAYSWGGELSSSEGDHDNSAEASSGVEQSGSRVPYFDTILASDVVYYPEGYQPLLATLCDLLGATDTAAPSAPVCILAHRHRHPEDSNFFDALHAVTSLHTEKLDFKVQSGGVDGNGGEVHALQDVVLFRITKRV